MCFSGVWGHRGLDPEDAHTYIHATMWIVYYSLSLDTIPISKTSIARKGPFIQNCPYNCDITDLIKRFLAAGSWTFSLEVDCDAQDAVSRGLDQPSLHRWKLIVVKLITTAT